MSQQEMERRGWDALDILLVTGDAYVDHPSFGAALLGRWLVEHGFRVGIVAQPRWRGEDGGQILDDIQAMGRPKLFAGITAGALDSMLAHYTGFRKLRHDDAFTPGGRHGARPNRATIAYTGLVRQTFPGLPVVIGGIEASLRRATHYDFWADRLRRSLLLDSKAEVLVYGMAERALFEIAKRLRDASGAEPEPSLLHGIPGTAFAPLRKANWTFPKSNREVMTFPSHEEIEAEAGQLMKATLMMEEHVHAGGAWATQTCAGRTVVFAPPAGPLTTEDLDRLHALPFTRMPHPSYEEPIPAADMIQFSIMSHRGCGGGCSFCSLSLHQGRRVRSRSPESIVQEAEQMAAHPQWKGSITDVGGPTANMWGARCTAAPAACKRRSCLSPSRCPYFADAQEDLLELLDRVRRVPGVKHLRVASGIRFDLALATPRYARDMVAHYVGGQLKLAPEHSEARVLQLMRKTSFDRFEHFLTIFDRESKRAGKEQFVIPYLMSAFPGCTDRDMRALAAWLKTRGWKPRQVQCFIPTPGTVATAMYYAGCDEEGNPIPVARTDAERMRQHRILLGDERKPAKKRGGKQRRRR